MNIDKLQQIILSDPARVLSPFGYSNFNKKADGYITADLNGEHEKIKFKEGYNGGVIVHYNGASHKSTSNIITFIMNSGGIKGAFTPMETANEIAKLYGVELDGAKSAPAYREHIRAIYDVITKIIDSDVSDYLTKRGFNISDKYGTAGRCFAALNSTAVNHLQAANIPAHVLQSLHLTETNIQKGYKLAIFEYVRGRLTGLQLRDITGKSDPKYLAASGGGKVITSPVIYTAAPVVYVEGTIDAYTLTKAGVPNVCALNGAAITTTQKHELIHTTGGAVYVPDKEYTDGGESQKAIELELRAMKQLAAVYSPLEVWTLPKGDKAGKVDANSYFANGGTLDGIIKEPVHKRFLRTLEQITDQRELIKAVGEYYAVLPLVEKTIFKRTEAIQTPDIYDYLRRVDGEKTAAARIEIKAKAIDLLQAGRIADARDTLQNVDGGGCSSLNIDQLINAAREQPKPIPLKTLPLYNYKKTPPNKELADYVTLKAGCITTIAALSGHGKTAMLCHIAKECAQKNYRVCYYSIEEGAPAILRRFVNILLDAPNKGADAFDYYAENNKTAIIDAVKNIDIPNVESNEIETFTAYLREHAGEYDIVCVDYIGLFSGQRDYSRTGEIKSITLELNRLAKLLDIPIVIGAQMNRDANAGEKALELLSIKQIAESAEIERISSYVYLLYKLTYIDGTGTDGLSANTAEYRRNMATDVDGLKTGIYIELVKNRFGGIYCNNVLGFYRGRITAYNANKISDSNDPYSLEQF